MSDEYKAKVLGSQSAFDDGGAAITNSMAGCYRAQLITSHGIKTDFPPAIAELGAINEANFEDMLKLAKIPYEREKVVKHEIEGLDSTVFSGRIDFVTTEKGKVIINELKSMSSPNSYSKIIKKKQYKPENLAQLIAYMVSTETVNGKLIYTYYKKNDQDEWVRKDMAEFDVLINDQGHIMVNDEDSGFTVQQYLTHRMKSARVLLDQEIVGRPRNWQDRFKGPCSFCTYAGACMKWDMKHIVSLDTFLDECRKEVINANNKEKAKNGKT